MLISRSALPVTRVVLPAYNEAADLPYLLDRLAQLHRHTGLPHEVLVVNDGSTDATASLVREYQAPYRLQLLDLQPNRGLAGAIRAGLAQSCEELPAEAVLITMDADNTHPPLHIPGMLAHMDAGADVVIASRYAPGASQTGLALHRVWLSTWASWLFRWLAPVAGARDYTCGYRAYRVALLQRAFAEYGARLIEQQGFAVMAELLLRLRRFQPVVMEVPLALAYDAKEGPSKMRLLRTIWQTLGLLGQYHRFRSAV